MTSNEAKLGAVAALLVSTWTTAHADDFRVTVTPTVNIDNVRVFSERLPGGGINGNSTRDSAVLSSSFGTLTAGTTATSILSTSYGTSTAADNSGNYANVSVLATTGTGGIVVGAQNGSTAFTFDDSFAGVNMANARAAVVSGTVSGVVPLFRAGRGYDNALFAYQQQATTQTGNLYSFVGGNTATLIGTYTVTPVPEPASFAALGLGALAVLRRRKKA